MLGRSDGFHCDIQTQGGKPCLKMREREREYEERKGRMGRGAEGEGQVRERWEERDTSFTKSNYFLFRSDAIC